ncbi:hypothetical protein [Zavarzinia sp. CC-PAN008]|uniref:hypothetical protein n=1 Tax=Zavarzinia sp. CC-PAN008 TaxID=3243332 RepID=UPI003F7465E9
MTVARLLKTVRATTTLAGIAVALGLAALPAQANPHYAGQYQCQMGNQTVSNNAFENWIYNYGLVLYPNGQFQAQGSYFAQTAGFNEGFQAQGQWQAQNGVLVGQGQQMKQSSGPGPFVWQLQDYGQGQFSYRMQGGSGVMAITCQRAG